MNTNSRKITLPLIFAIITLLLFNISCKKELENINVDQKGIPYGPYVPGLTLASMETNILIITPAWQYQLQQNLNGDMYSGYMSTASAFAAGVNNLTYFMMDGWNGFISSVCFTGVMDPWITVNSITSKPENKSADFNAIAKIIKVLSFHRLTDVHGPLPYTRYGQSDTVAFDGQDVIYHTFFTELTKAVNVLDSTIKADTTASSRWALYDQSTYKGDYKKWIKLANTLRLRLALRISNVEPEKAKTEAEAAVNHPIGVLSSLEGPFAIINTTRQNPLYTLSQVWGDCSVGAPLECILGGYNDPRLPKYALPATDPDVNGQYKGIRQGIALPNSQLYRQYSHPNIGSTDPLIIMTAAESYFLRAEGALKGWNMGGTAKDFYENGIRASFKQWNVSGDDTYINDSQSKPKPYVDTKNSVNSINTSDPNLSTITIKWDEVATNAQKLERIITQKWIAMYPEGQEAWSEFRRTGYPKLFPVVVNNSNGEIPSGEFIKRIPYPTSITSTSPQSAVAIQKYFGGHDGSFKPLWWDVN